MVGSVVAEAPKKLKDFPSVKLLKGDKYKLDLAEFIEQQNVLITGSTVVKSESRFGTFYRELAAPQYVYKKEGTAQPALSMNKCMFGSLGKTNNDVICGEKTGLAYWHFEMDDKTNTLVNKPDSTYARFLGKDAAEVTSLKIDTCEHMVVEAGKGRWAVCYSEKTGTATDRDVKIVLVHISSGSAGGDDPYKGIRTVVLSQTDVKYPYLTSDFSMQIVQTSTGSSTYILRKNRYKSEDAAAATDRSKIRVFKINNVSSTGSTLSIAEDDVVDFKDMPIDIATPTATKFGTESEIMSIAQRGLGGLTFTVKVKDPAQSKLFKEIKIFHMTFTRDTTNNKWTFSPVNKAVLTVPKNDFGVLKTASIVPYLDSTTTPAKKGFFLVNLEKIAYFGYDLQSNENWNLKKKFERVLKCLPEQQNYVSSVAPQTSLGYNKRPEQALLFIKYRSGATNKKVSGFANYNLLTNRYSCKTDQKTELEQMVSDQKMVTFEDGMIKHYRVADSTYLSIDYEKMDKTNVQKDYTFKVQNTFDSTETSFTIKGTAYKEYTDARLASPPKPKIKAYAKEWITLPFRAHNLAANNPETSVMIGTEAVKPADVRIFYKNELALSFKLPTHTSSTATTKDYISSDITDMIAVDSNTFLAVQVQPGQKDSYWVLNCESTVGTDNKLAMTCSEPPMRNELKTTDEYIAGAYRIKEWIVVILKSRLYQSTTTYKTVLRPVNRATQVVESDFVINGVTATSFDFLVDGPIGFLVFVGHLGPTSVTMTEKAQREHNLQQSFTKKLYVTKAEITDEGKLKFSNNGNGINDSTGTNICPNTVHFESTSDANQKTRFVVRSQCIGKPATIQEVITNSDYTEIIQVTRKRIIHESGYQICPTKGEVVVFVPRKRRLFAFNLGNSDEYEYPLVETGITKPLLMNCVAEKNLVQIVGYGAGKALFMANFIGGNSEEPASRIHSVIPIAGANSDRTVVRVSAGYKEDSSKVSTFVSFIGATTTLTDKTVKKTIFSLDLDGPIIQYKTPEATVTLKVGLKTKADLKDDEFATLIVENAPLNDVVAMQPLQDIEKVGDKIDLEKHVEYSGAVTDGMLETTLGTDKVELVSSRKMKQPGLFEDTSINVLDMYTHGKWTVFHYQDGSNKQIDFVWDAAKRDTASPVVDEINPVTGTYYGFSHIPPTTSESKQIVSVTRFSKRGFNSQSAKVYGYKFFKAYTLDVNGKKTARLTQYSDVTVPGININDQFQAVMVDDSNIVVCERRAQGEYLNFYQFKLSAGSYSLDESKTQGVGLKFNAVDYTTVFIQNKVVVLYTSIESAKIGFVIYDPAGGPIVKGWFDADDKQELLPAGIDCLLTKNNNKQLSCFVDTVGPTNYEVKYTIGSTTKADGFITARELIDKAKFESPKGFERIQTVQSHDYTAVLYKNTQREEPKQVSMFNARLFLKNLQVSTAIYACRHIMEVYKKPQKYSYITYTCKDFRIDLSNKTDVPKIAMFEDQIFISQHQALPAPKMLGSGSTTSSGSVTPTPVVKNYRIMSFKTGGFSIHVKDPSLDLKQISFKVYGNNGNSSSKTVEQLMKAKKSDDGDSSGKFLFWVFIILAVVLIAIVGFVLFKKMSGGIEEQPGYSKDVSNSRPSDMDDTRL